MQRIMVEGHGYHNFPDGMSKEEIGALLEQKYPSAAPVQNNPLLGPRLQGAMREAQQGANFGGPIAGMTDVIRAPIQMAAHAIAPKEVSEFAPSGEGLGYQATNLAVPGGAFAKLGGLAGRLARPAILGSSEAFQHPQDMLQSGLLGAAGGVLGEGVGAVAKHIPKIAESFMPGRVAKEVPAMLEQLFRKYKKEGNELFDPLINEHGKQSLIKKGAYGENLELNPLHNLLGHKKIKDMSQDFLSNPNISNAHKLQSDLEKRIRRLYKTEGKSGLTDAQGKMLDLYEKARQSILDQMATAFSRVSPQAGKQYKAAQNLWATKVKPLEELAAKTAGKKDFSPKNINNVYEVMKAKQREAAIRGGNAPIIPEEAEDIFMKLKGLIENRNKALGGAGALGLGGGALELANLLGLFRGGE